MAMTGISTAISVLIGLVSAVLWVTIAVAAGWYWSKNRTLGVLLQAIGGALFVLNSLGWLLFQVVIMLGHFSPGVYYAVSTLLQLLNFAGLVIFAGGYAIERFGLASKPRQGFPV